MSEAELLQRIIHQYQDELRLMEQYDDNRIDFYGFGEYVAESLMDGGFID